MQHTVREELSGTLAFLGTVWVVFLADWVFPIDLLRFGVTPRTGMGLIGIAAMPFLHANWSHLISNTVPLFVLLGLLAGSRARSSGVVVGLIVASGLLLWVIGRPYTHVGASGLVFSLVTFLIVSGFRERRISALLISLLVCFLYGGTLVGGVLPQSDSTISWDGHLAGAVAGALMACVATRRGNDDRKSRPAGKD